MSLDVQPLRGNYLSDNEITNKPCVVIFRVENYQLQSLPSLSLSFNGCCFNCLLWKVMQKVEEIISRKQLLFPYTENLEVMAEVLDKIVSQSMAKWVQCTQWILLRRLSCGNTIPVFLRNYNAVYTHCCFCWINIAHIVTLHWSVWWWPQGMVVVWVLYGL